MLSNAVRRTRSRCNRRCHIIRPYCPVKHTSKFSEELLQQIECSSVHIATVFSSSQILATWKLTCAPTPTIDLFHVLLKGVVNHLLQKVIYKLTFWYIPVKSPTVVTFAASPMLDQVGSKFIKGRIQVRNHLSVKFVELVLRRMEISRRTCGYILVKNLLGASSKVVEKVLRLRVI